MGGVLDIVASNSFIQALGEEARTSFEEMEPLEAKKMSAGSADGKFQNTLKDGREEEHQIPGATQKRPVKEVDLQTVLPPIAKYDAITFQKAFAELRQRNQKPAEVSP